MGQKRRRKEVLVPGSLLPVPQPGKFHGVITSAKLCENTGRQIATVALSDERLKLQIPWLEVQQYVIEQPGSRQKRSRYATTDPARSTNGQVAKVSLTTQSSAPLMDDGMRAASGGSGSIPSCGVLDVAAPEPPPPPSERCGALLQARLTVIMEVALSRWPLGTKLWLKLRGYCPWPVLMWSARICRKKDMDLLLTTYKPGTVLVRFYGEHSSMWVKEAELEDFDIEDESRFQQLKAWGRQHNKASLIESVVEEVESAIEDADGEVERLQEIEKQSIAARGPGLECAQCQEEGASAACSECERVFHTLCMQPPALKAADLPDAAWTCTFCGHTNLVGDCFHEDEKELTVERMGLTPDWIIQAAAFDVFKLEQPTSERPYIKGLLDPCTNSMAAPNIPAEVLYDKQMNGLKLSNSWAGFLILLNPPYTAATQWRFVNRAIDEVENDQVPAVLLLCRNSTDTAYFQRLRPYPRVLLRRTNTRFKDYSKTPIGFGICVFAIAKSSCRDLYSRFFNAFADMGEPNIPIDKTIMHTDAFHELLERLRRHAEEHYRDHWIQCSTCCKWRIINYDAMLLAKDSDWTCRQLRPPFTSCRTQQTKREVLGGRYAALGADGDLFEAEKVDYSIPRLDLPPKDITADVVQEVLEEAVTAAVEATAPPSEAAEDPDIIPRAAVIVPQSTVERFVKLPARPIKARATPQAPQVLSAIELARQARIAANRAYLASLKMGPRAIASGNVTPVAADDELVLSAARLLAEKAAVEEARSQVDCARRYWARTSVACEREERQLRAATEANAEELRAAKSYVVDAEAALAELEARQLAKRQREAVKEPPADPIVLSPNPVEPVDPLEAAPEQHSYQHLDASRGDATLSCGFASEAREAPAAGLRTAAPCHAMSGGVAASGERSAAQGMPEQPPSSGCLGYYPGQLTSWPPAWYMGSTQQFAALQAAGSVGSTSWWGAGMKPGLQLTSFMPQPFTGGVLSNQQHLQPRTDPATCKAGAGLLQQAATELSNPAVWWPAGESGFKPLQPTALRAADFSNWNMAREGAPLPFNSGLQRPPRYPDSTAQTVTMAGGLADLLPAKSSSKRA